MRTTISVVVLVAALTGCSGGGDGGGGGGDEEPDRADSRGLPSCQNAWVTPEALRADYLGCKDGGEVTDDIIDCDDRIRKLAWYDSRYYAFIGQQIHDYETEPGMRRGWGSAVESCRSGP